MTSSRHVAFLAVEQASGERGGAEAFHDGFCDALRQLGWVVDKIVLTIDESRFEGLLEGYLRAYDLDVSQYDLVISSKAPSYAVRHPRHLCYLQHTIRVFYDMFDIEFPKPWPELIAQRKRIIELDSALLSEKRVARIFTNGDETLRRLRKFNRLDGEVLYPGLLRDHFTQGDYGDYMFLPGRLHRWKRVDLLIEAMSYVKSPIELRIAGTGEDQPALLERIRRDPCIRLLGRLGDEQVIEQYSGAFAVPFVPIMEDFGYITLEAFRSGKPVITASDSGTPVDLVAGNEAGVVVAPEAKSLAAAIDEFASDRERCREMGLRGYEGTKGITWEAAARRVASSAAELFGL